MFRVFTVAVLVVAASAAGAGVALADDTSGDYNQHSQTCSDSGLNLLDCADVNVLDFHHNDNAASHGGGSGK